VVPLAAGVPEVTMSSPIRVLHVAVLDDSLKYLLKSQLEYLREQGYEIHAMSSPGRWRRDLEAAGIRFHAAPLLRRFSPLADLRAILTMVRVFRRERIDIVHTHVAKAALLGQIAARLARVPLTVNTVHGFLFTDFTSRLRRLAFLWLERITAAFADLELFQSQEKLELAVEVGVCRRDRARHIGNGINTVLFDPTRFPPDAPRRARAALGLSPDAVVVGMVAFYSRQKGYMELFEAARMLAAEFPSIRFLTVGVSLSQGIRNPIPWDILQRSGLSDRVIHLEDREDMPELYSCMDIVTLPSHREGLPRCLMEAAMMGKPIVASNISGNREVVEEGVNGFLVPVRDASALVEAIRRLAKDPTLRQRMGAAGRQKALAAFDEQRVFEKVAQGYRDMLEVRTIQRRPVPVGPSGPEPTRVLHVAVIDDSLKFLLKNQLLYLRSKGYEVHAISSPGRWRAELEAAGLRFHPVRLLRRFSPLSDIFSVIMMVRIFRRERVHIVHTHIAKAALLGQLAAWIARVPLSINTIHGFLFTGFRRTLQRQFFSKLERLTALFANVTLFQSQENYEVALSERVCEPRRAVHIGNGIELGLFVPESFHVEDIRRKRREVGLPGDAVVVGIVGFYTRRKGYFEFYQAARTLKEQFPHVWFLTVGASLSQGARNPIPLDLVDRYGLRDRTVNLEDRADMPALYACMDIVVLPSYWEGLPRCLMEAAAMRKPIVASDISGNREVVDNGVNGFLVPPRDVGTLTEAIARLVRDPELRLGMGVQGHEKAHRLFDETRVFATIDGIYREWLKTSRRVPVPTGEATTPTGGRR
jgi:glycosyltransferase involved in cell wall biosynthesis